MAVDSAVSVEFLVRAAADCLLTEKGDFAELSVELEESNSAAPTRPLAKLRWSSEVSAGLMRQLHSPREKTQNPSGLPV
jgi:hypothetical protein